MAIIGIILAIIYLISPVDLIPDVIPVIGLIDDVIVIAMAGAFAMEQWR